MATTLNQVARAHAHPASAVVRTMIVGLTLATAEIHVSLGGLLFLANAVVYATLAIAMVLPGPIGQVRWLVRLALVGFTAATIGGWLLFGARFPLAYFDKGIEILLVAVVSFELWRNDGGPLGVLRQARRLLARVTGMQTARGPR
jgi:hypothetical protein